MHPRGFSRVRKQLFPLKICSDALSDPTPSHSAGNSQSVKMEFEDENMPVDPNTGMFGEASTYREGHVIEEIGAYVKKHRALWHPTDSRKKDAKLKREAFLHIGKHIMMLCGLPDDQIVDLASRKWRNMRTCFMRGKKGGKSGSGRSDPVTNTYVYAPYLQFLNEVPDKRR